MVDRLQKAGTEETGARWRDSRPDPVSAYVNHLGPGSRRTMQRSLRTTAEILGGPKTDPATFRWEALRPEDVMRLRRTLMDRYAPATVNKMLSALRGVLWAARDLRLITDEAFNGLGQIHWVRMVDRDGVPAIAAADISKLFRTCADDPTPAGRRDAALLAILLSSGMRRAEVVTLGLEDYTRTTGSLRVSAGDEARDRTVELGVEARAAVAAWLHERGSRPGPLLLPVNKGGVVQHRRLTDQAIYDMVTRLAVRAGIPHVTTRALRRAYVVALIAAGYDLEEVQRRLGHASWVTTASYRRLVKEHGPDQSGILDVPFVSRGAQRNEGEQDASDHR